MKKLGKKLAKIVLFVFVLLVVLLIAVYFGFGFIVQKAVTGIVPSITQTEAHIEQVDLSLWKGQLSFANFIIGNPKGFSDHNAFKIQKVMVEFDPKSIFSGTVVIKQVRINGTEITAELNKSGDINLNTLYRNVNSYVGTEKTPPQKTEKESAQTTGKGKGVLLKKLSVTDSSVNLVVFDHNQRIPLPDVNYQDKGERRSFAETVVFVMNKLIKESLTGIQNLGGDLINSQLKNLKNIGNEVGNLTSQAGRKLNDGLNGIKKLF